MSPSLDPRRENERVYFDGEPLTIITEGGKHEDAELADISTDGVGVFCRTGFYPGDQATLVFSVHEHLFRIRGVVRRVNGKEVYISYIELTETDREEIERIISEHGSVRKRRT